METISLTVDSLDSRISGQWKGSSMLPGRRVKGLAGAIAPICLQDRLLANGVPLFALIKVQDVSVLPVNSTPRRSSFH